MSELLTNLRDPDYAGVMQHCRSSSEIDNLFNAAADEIESLRVALKGLIDHTEINTCQHEDTKRGGTIWTICCDCGWRWADDEGGFQPYERAPALVAAWAALPANPDAPNVDDVATQSDTKAGSGLNPKGGPA